MKHIFLVFLPAFIFIACNSSSNSKVNSLQSTKTVNADSAGTKSDNFLIDNTVDQKKGPVYMYCEKMPEFPGGEEAFHNFMRSRIKYPPLAVSDKIEGRVVLKFIIRANGKPEDIQVFRGLRADLDTVCIRAMREMPMWHAGMIGDKPVSVSYSIPVRFLLNKSENLNGIYILPGN